MKQIFETPISFLKSDNLLNAEQAYSSRQIDAESLKAVQDEEILKLIEAQKSVGLETITDGSFRNLLGLRDFWMWLQGVTPTVVTSGHVYQDQNSGEVIPRVTDKVAHNPAHSILNSFSFLQANAGDGQVIRMDIPAPSQFLVELVRNGWYDTSVYSSIEDLAADIAAAYHGTLKDLYDLGCRRILLIDPSWGRLCDHYASKRLIQGGIDLIELPKVMRSTNDDAICDLPSDMRIILYTPVESPVREYYSEVIDELLEHQRVDSYMFDWRDDEKVVIPFISKIPANKELIIGIGDTQEPQLDGIGQIKAVLDRATKANPEIIVRISTKGGFTNNTDSFDCSAITEIDQWNKIKNLLDIDNA